MVSLNLEYDDYFANLSSGLQGLLTTSEFFDVTLAVEGKFFKAHQMILSIFSPYFQELFAANPCKQTIFFMKNVKYKVMKDLLAFMYEGKVQIREEEFNQFMDTATELRIRGLLRGAASAAVAAATTAINEQEGALEVAVRNNADNDNAPVLKRQVDVRQTSVEVASHSSKKFKAARVEPEVVIVPSVTLKRERIDLEIGPTKIQYDDEDDNSNDGGRDFQMDEQMIDFDNSADDCYDEECDVVDEVQIQQHSHAKPLNEVAEAKQDTLLMPPIRTPTLNSGEPVDAGCKPIPQLAAYDDSTRNEVITNLCSTILHTVQAQTAMLSSFIREMHAGRTGSEVIPVIEELPLTTLEDLRNLEEKLSDDAFCTSLGLHLRGIGGTNGKEFVVRMLKDVFRNELAVKCSWFGRRNNAKLCHLKLIQLMRTRAKLAFPDLTDLHFVKTVQEWFRVSKLRLDRQKTILI